MRGFIVVLIAVEIQFKRVKDRDQVGAQFNVASKEENMTIFERYHRAIEERYRYYHTMLPFKNIPRQMVCNF